MSLVEQELLTLPGHLGLPPVFSGVRVTRSLILYVCFVDRCLSFCTFSFDHCVVCSSSIYGFWLPLWYLQTLLLTDNILTVLDYMSNTARMSYKKQELLTLLEHLGTLVGSVLLIFSVFWVLFLDLFVFVLCLVYNVVCVIPDCPFGFL